MADRTASRERPRGVVRRVADPVLIGCFALLLGFPVAAWVAAERQPVVPAPSHAVAVPSGPGAALELRDVPAFEAEPGLAAVLESRSGMRSAVRAALTDAFGAPIGPALFRLVRDFEADIHSTDAVLAEVIPYPFRYPPIDRLLDGVAIDPRTGNDVAALLILAAAPGGASDAIDFEFPNAPEVAFALLDSARAGGDCLPQLNLAFLLSSDRNSRDDDVVREYEAAARACPGDPTPIWLLGQFQSQRAFADDRDADFAGQQLARAERLARPFATFRRLQQRWPRSPLGWAGEADTELRLAYQVDPRQPFGGRLHFRRALALYRAARRVDDDPGLATGEARALAGLGFHGRAADLHAVAVEGAAHRGPPRARHVEYLERAGRFDEAAAAAAALAADPAFAPPRALFPQADDAALLFREDGAGPVSTGSDRLWAVQLNVGPPPGGRGAAGADLSFIPLYRVQPGVTGHDRWCPEWARRRDLVLAGHADEALQGMPEQYRDARPWAQAPCQIDGTSLLRALALLETGDRDAAIASAKEANLGGDRAPAAVLADAGQDLWRFAGDRVRAARIAAEWADGRPLDPDAPDRAGEIAFLEGDYSRAARWFGRAVRTARSAFGGWTTQEARALLKRGVALARLGELDAALAALAEGDEVATRVEAFARDEEFGTGTAELEAAWFSYHARAQAGDVALRARRYARAAEHYESAQERLPALELNLPVLGIDPLVRPEVLHNNRSLAENKAGRLAPALETARRAVAADPANPLFRETEGFALQRLGRRAEAVRAYRIGLASDPTLYPAWNDLGVLLLDQGRTAAAADALRRAVGANDDYAIGWFNLGVAQEDRGRLLAAQGAFGRAIALDERLRDRPHDPIADDAVYITQLDLSKLLPHEWSFAGAQERAPAVAAGFAVVLMLGLRLARGLAVQSTGVARELFDAGRGWLERLPAALRFTPAAVAALATLAVFVWPLLRTGGASLASVLLLAAGVALLVTIVLRARVLAARHAGVTLEHRGWSPAVAFGLAAGAAGAPWAPLPVAVTSRPAPAVHWLGPVLTGAAALGLLILAAWLHVPVTRALGAAALVMAASMLTPIEPLDGAMVGKGAAGLAATLALLGTGVLLLLGLV
jgi:cellulose synthase operon protein C